jgi:hypothetical protein
MTPHALKRPTKSIYAAFRNKMMELYTVKKVDGKLRQPDRM